MMMDIFESRNAGKILRVKVGYNPNSSSVGSQIPALFFFYAGSGALAVMTLHTFRWVEKLLRKQGSKKHPTSKKDLNWFYERILKTGGKF